MKTLEQLASTAEEWISSRYGVVRGHPEWRALVEAFEAGQASARAACRAEALEEAAQRCEDIGDEYQEREGRRYAELRSDAEMGSKHCAAAIREMK